MSRLDPLIDDLERVADGYLVVVTGAGVSLASGIPTFRGDDPEAVWHHSITELGTYRFFRHDPVTNWQWSLDRFSKIPAARPNPAHEALVELERLRGDRGDGEFLLVTQNIDTLHEQAGSRALVKVHGSIDRFRCASERGCGLGSPAGSIARDTVDLGEFVDSPSLDTVPRCPDCGDLLRQHVLWFDEFYADHDDFQWPRVQDAAARADLVLFVGTSFAVGVTEVFLQSALLRGVPAWSIDPAGLRPYPGLRVVEARAEEALPALVERLA